MLKAIVFIVATLFGVFLVVKCVVAALERPGYWGFAVLAMAGLLVLKVTTFDISAPLTALGVICFTAVNVAFMESYAIVGFVRAVLFLAVSIAVMVGLIRLGI